MFDAELKKHDLNPLIKVSGGYLVDDSDPDTSLFINVCRDIGKKLCVEKRMVKGCFEALPHCLFPSASYYMWMFLTPVRASKKAFILNDVFFA